MKKLFGKVNVELEEVISKLKANDEAKLVLNLDDMWVKESHEINIALEALKRNNKVTKLYLSSKYVEDSEIYKLIEILSVNVTLELIQIGTNNISDSSYVALAKALEMNTNILSLQIRGAACMGKRGIEAFQKTLKVNRTLVFLTLGIDSSLQGKTDEFTQAIKDNPTICDGYLYYYDAKELKDKNRSRAPEVKSKQSVKTIMDNPLRMDIFPALRSGNLSRVQKLIDSGLSVDTTVYISFPHNGYTPLMLAVRANDTDAVKLLLQYDKHFLKKTGTSKLTRKQLEERNLNSEEDRLKKSIANGMTGWDYLPFHIGEDILADMLVVYPEDVNQNAEEMARKRGLTEIAELIKEAGKNPPARQAEKSPQSALQDLKLSQTSREVVAMRYLTPREQVKRVTDAVDKNDVKEVKLLIASKAAIDNPEKTDIPLFGCDIYLMSELPSSWRYINSYIFTKKPFLSFYYIDDKEKITLLKLDDKQFRALKIDNINETKPLNNQISKQNLEKLWKIIRLNAGHIPLIKALEKHNNEILRLLLESKASVSSVPVFQIAADEGYEDTLRLLVESKGDINKKNDEATALHVAVNQTNEKITSLLMELKADPNIPYSKNNTPTLKLAIEQKQEHLVTVLIKARADVNAVDQYGIGALKQAVAQQEGNIVKSLLAARANPNVEDKNRGEIPLMSDQENIGITQQLIDAKSDVNWISKEGVTPIQKAACNGFQATTHLLIEAKANLAYVNKFGASVLPLVVQAPKLDEQSKLSIVKLLLAGGASIFSKSGDKTASQIANEAGYRDLVRYLQPLEQAALAAPSGVVSPLPPASAADAKNVASPFAIMPALKAEEFVINFSIKYSDLTIEQPAIGEGAYGVVYKGQWQLNPVAIKKLNGLDFDAGMLNEIQNEAKVMAQISTRSEYLVKLKGICLEKPHYCLVMEYLPNGNLYQYLHSGADIAWERRYAIGCGIAIGVMHLHSAGVLHRDLKSLNVLLDSNFNPKLGDFGLAKLKNESNSSKSGIKGTPAWMAPELLDFKQVENEPTAASDIFSLGIVLWELASRELPFGKKPAMQILGLMMSGVRAYKTLPADCPVAFKLLIETCCHEIPAKRPSAENIANQLNSLWQENRRKAPSLPTPPASALSSASDYLSGGRSYGGSFKPLSAS